MNDAAFPVAAILAIALIGALCYIGQIIQSARRWRHFVALVGGEDMAEANIERLEIDAQKFERSIWDSFARSSDYAKRRARFNDGEAS